MQHAGLRMFFKMNLCMLCLKSGEGVEESYASAEGPLCIHAYMHAAYVWGFGRVCCTCR